MFPPKFSKLSTFAISRVEEVRRQINSLKGDLKLNGLPNLKDDPKARRDRYFASMPILIKSFFNYLENEIAINQPIIHWETNDNFKSGFLRTYSKLITDLSVKYFRNLRKQTSDSLNRKSAGETTELNEDERAYLSFVLDDPKPNGGVTVLSPIDGLFVISHIAGLIIDLGVNDSQRFNKILNSRGVSIFTNSLMINESDGMTSLMKLLSSDHKTEEHKSTSYSFSPDFFTVTTDNNIVLRNDILSVVRRVFEQNKDIIGVVDRRNCPASYAPKETNAFFDMIIRELTAQYNNFLSK